MYNFLLHMYILLIYSAILKEFESYLRFVVTCRRKKERENRVPLAFGIAGPNGGLVEQTISSVVERASIVFGCGSCLPPPQVDWLLSHCLYMLSASSCCFSHFWWCIDFLSFSLGRIYKFSIEEKRLPMAKPNEWESAWFYIKKDFSSYQLQLYIILLYLLLQINELLYCVL